MAPIRHCRRLDELQREEWRKQSAHGRLRRTHPKGGRTRRFAGPAADQVRAGHQPGDRQGARPDDPTHGVAARRRGLRVKRRDFIAAAGVAALAPTAILAQQRKMATVALLLGGSFPEFQIGVFRQGLQDLGYVEGQSIRVEIHSAEDDAQRLPELAAALVRDKVDVIVPFGTNGALAAKHATSEIPIVLLANSDPVGVGLVNSLAHPGGNITGTSRMHAELAAKHVELLQDMLPNLRRVAALSNSADAFFGQVFVKQVALAARQIEIEPMTVAAGAELDA